MILNINITTKYRFVTYFFAAGFDPLKGQASLRCWWLWKEAARLHRLPTSSLSHPSFCHSSCPAPHVGCSRRLSCTVSSSTPHPLSLRTGKVVRVESPFALFSAATCFHSPFGLVSRRMFWLAFDRFVLNRNIP
jgi:hypothetical protein